jgi:hypothetical protein
MKLFERLMSPNQARNNRVLSKAHEFIDVFKYDEEVDLELVDERIEQVFKNLWKFINEDEDALYSIFPMLPIISKQMEKDYEKVSGEEYFLRLTNGIRGIYDRMRNALSEEDRRLLDQYNTSLSSIMDTE